MIIKVILLVFAYLLTGVAILEGLLCYDRRSYSRSNWIDYRDDFEQVMVVAFWPLILPIIIIGVLYIGLVRFIKIVRIFFTTIVYLIAVIIDKREGE